MENSIQDLATELAPLYKQIAPESYSNMIAFEDVAQDCRIGRKPGKPFSGVTIVHDFCAHSHRDNQNMNAGCTVVRRLFFGAWKDMTLRIQHTFFFRC